MGEVRKGENLFLVRGLMLKLDGLSQRYPQYTTYQRLLKNKASGKVCWYF